MAADEWGEPIVSDSVNRWKPGGIGESITGTVTELIDGKYGKEAKIRQEDGVIISTPGHAYLKGLVEKLKVGQRVKISVTGAKKGAKGGTGWLYDVRVSKLMQIDQVPPQSQILDSAGKIVDTLKHAPAGIEDKAFWQAAMKEAKDFPDCMQIVEKLKNEGRIVCVSGLWKAT